MFHPGVLRVEVAARLTGTTEAVYRRRGPQFPIRGSSGRLDFLAIAVALALPLFVARAVRRHETAALAVIATALALLGAVVWGAAIVSAIPAVRYNEAALVVMPLDAVLPFLRPAWQRRYARVRLAILAGVIMLGVAGVVRQPLWILVLIAVLPMLTLAFDLPHGRATRPA
jgi:hypothetical protein